MTPEEAYPFWRFDMWLKGYGTYREIDEAVEKGKLIPFKQYSEKEKPKPSEC